MDAARTGFVLVSTPEHLPVAETERAATALRRNGVPVAGLVANRVRSSDGEAQYLRHLEAIARPSALLQLAEQPGPLRGVDRLRAVADVIAGIAP